MPSLHTIIQKARACYACFLKWFNMISFIHVIFKIICDEEALPWDQTADLSGQNFLSTVMSLLSRTCTTREGWEARNAD